MTHGTKSELKKLFLISTIQNRFCKYEVKEIEIRNKKICWSVL